MPNLAFNFGGAQLYIPGPYYQDSIIPGSPPLPPTPPLLIIGCAQGPAPQTISTFANVQDFVNTIRGGQVSALVPFIQTPSPQLSGTGNITFIDASANTQGTSSLKTSVTGNAALVNMTTVLYGLPSNQMQAQVAAGAAGGPAINLTLFDGYANETYTGLNLGVPMQVAYTGTASSGVTYTIAGTAGAATTITLTDGTVTFAIPLAVYTTLNEVIENINGTGYFAAQSVSSTNGQLSPVLLDPASAVALTKPVSNIPQWVNATSSIPDVVLWINNTGVVTAVAAAIASSTTVSYLVQPLTHFIGATTSLGSTLSNYGAAFTLGLSTPAFAVISDLNTPAVQALGNQHQLLARAIPTRKWRRFWTGSSLADSVTTTVANAQALDSYGTIYAYPGITYTSTVTGLPTTVGGWAVAVMCASMSVGNNVNTPLTNKPLLASGVEVNLTLSQLQTLLANGVMPVAVNLNQNDNVPRIVRDLTTWQVDSYPQNFSSQQVACRDYLAYSLVNACAPYIGSIASAVTEVNIFKAVVKMLNALVYPGNQNGVLSSWDSTSLVVQYNGLNQVAGVSVNVTLVNENAFITISTGLEELDLTIAAAA